MLPWFPRKLGAKSWVCFCPGSEVSKFLRFQRFWRHLLRFRRTKLRSHQRSIAFLLQIFLRVEETNPVFDAASPERTWRGIFCYTVNRALDAQFVNTAVISLTWPVSFLDAPSHLYKRLCPSVGPYVPCYFRRWKARILGASCAVYPALLDAFSHL